MVGSGEKERETIRPEFDRSIMIDFQGAKITSDTGFLLLREIDERFELNQGRSESRVSWSKVASPCGFCVPLGPSYRAVFG